MTLGAGLVLMGCGDDAPATTPAPAPPPPPPPAPEPEPEPPPAPEAPATPTGFHVDTTQTSLTWHWNAVEGAIGYAVQVSMDEMFDADDTITPTAETSFTVADLPPQTTLYGRVAAAAGTLEAPILSAWTTHVTGTTDMPPPPPPPPMAPATPTGLMAEEGEGSITWSWDAVEGADGYAVQVSADEMFDDMDETTYTMETMHTVSDLDYGETRFARVASTSGEGEDMLMSMFTTHVTGMSMAEPPPEPPPAPDPVEVTFMVPDDDDFKGSPYPLVPDESKDKEKAMATVNEKIMVESNTGAIITPMFVEGANGVTVMEGENMPFARVSWSLLQSAVVSDGATFMIQRATIGANQEMEPSGDVAYVTCGPFECMEGMDAPDIGIGNSAACEAWDPTLELQVGLIDNSGDSHTGRAFVASGDNPDTDATESDFTGIVEVAVFDGLDLGWTYTSDDKFNAKHDLAVVSGTKKGIAKKSSATPLPSSSIGAITLGVAATPSTDNRPQTYYALSAEGEDDRTTSPDEGSCQPVSASADSGLWDYNDNTRSRISRPENCFRLTVDAGLERNYLDPYEVELTLASAQLTWGEIAWDAFEDITCEPRTFEAAAQVDVCEMLAEDVDRLPTPSAVPVVQNENGDTTNTNTASSNVTGKTLAGFNLKFKDAGDSRHRFVGMWYLDDTTKKPDDDTHNLYAARTFDLDDDDTDDTNPVNATTGSLIGTTADMTIGAEGAVWVPTLDKDFDPMYGDLGKVDDAGDDKADNFGSNDDSNACTADDGGSGRTKDADGNDQNNGTLCDAEDVEIMTSVSFVDGLGYGCDPIEVEYTLTCDWSTRGNQASLVTDSNTEITYTVSGADVTTNIDQYVKCTVE